MPPFGKGSWLVRGLIQRVSEAQVVAEDRCVGAIGQGLLLLLAIEAGDNDTKVDKLAHKVVNYRVFADDAGKMNRSLLDIDGGLLVISQFTLAADTQKGLRPGFSSAAAPELAQKLYQNFLNAVVQYDNIRLEKGIFAADMKVSLVNDGPVTFLLEV